MTVEVDFAKHQEKKQASHAKLCYFSRLLQAGVAGN